VGNTHYRTADDRRMDEAMNGNRSKIRGIFVDSKGLPI